MINESKRNHLRRIASSGGKATLKKYSKNYFSLLAKKSWIKRNAKRLQNISTDSK